MEQLRDDIKDTMQVLKKIAALLYQQKAQEGYAELDAALQCLLLTVSRMAAYQKDKENKIIDEELMNIALNEALKAIEQKDIVLLADILIFELNGLLDESLNHI